VNGPPGKTNGPPLSLDGPPDDTNLDPADQAKSSVIVTPAGDDLASRIADAWGPALLSSQRFGYRCGYRVGVFHGRAEESRRWQVTWTGVNTMLSIPARAELERARLVDNRPCRNRTCGGRCSRCIRARAAATNQGRYGSPDFPGTGHAA
jgi:hypothetical protein